LFSIFGEAEGVLKVMKIVFVFDSALFFTAYEDLIRYLCQKGHDIKIVYGKGRKPFPVDGPLEKFLLETNNCKAEPLLKRRGWRWLLTITRRLLDRAPYLEPEHPSPWLVNRRTGFSRPIRLLLDTPLAKRILKDERFQNKLKWFENNIPPEPTIMRWLNNVSPDIIVVAPYILYNDHYEAEYVKAAGSLGIPTMMFLNSWDHLLSKCTFQIIPDWILVWNRVLMNDAVKFHRIPINKMLITGTPQFDAWFEMQPALDRDVFCEQVGLNPKRRFISYLCSALNGNEAQFVDEFAKKLLMNPQTRDLEILVRPYPSNIGIWKDFNAENVVIWPKTGGMPDLPEAKMGYFHTLYHGEAVVGISTTAFLEAAVIDRPCLTLMTDTFRYAHRMGHFQYLLDADFLEKAVSHEDASDKLAAILNGADVKADNRHRFVRDFVRPKGVEMPVFPIMANILESIGHGDQAAIEKFNSYLSQQ
jgi:hypothetical protein